MFDWWTKKNNYFLSMSFNSCIKFDLLWVLYIDVDISREILEAWGTFCIRKLFSLLTNYKVC